MKVIIFGVGQVGVSVVEGFVLEENDIMIVDYDVVCLVYFQDRFDLWIVVGDVVIFLVLCSVGVEDVDMIIVVM